MGIDSHAGSELEVRTSQAMTGPALAALVQVDEDLNLVAGLDGSQIATGSFLHVGTCRPFVVAVAGLSDVDQANLGHAIHLLYVEFFNVLAL